MTQRRDAAVTAFDLDDGFATYNKIETVLATPTLR
jgi:hypothetical protein